MGKTNSNPKKWHRQLQYLAAKQDEAFVLSELLRDGEYDRNRMDLLHSKISFLRELTIELIDEMISGPVCKLATGKALTDVEFNFLRAGGCVSSLTNELGLSPVSDHDVMEHLRYDDGKFSTYIDPSLTESVVNFDQCKKTKNVKIRFNRHPEELKEKHLRPAQRDFLKQHLPDVLERFSTEENTSVIDQSQPQAEPVKEAS